MKHVMTATMLTLGATAAHASVNALAIETLMHAQAQEALALSIVASPATQATLQYQFLVDTNSGAFSYQALPGQTYDGQSYSLSAAGSLDTNTQTYMWSATGMLGSRAWSQSGQAQWVGDPTATVSGNVSLGGSVVGTFSGDLEVDAMGHSSGQGTFTPTGGSPGVYNVTDYVPGGSQPWTLIWSGHPAQFVPASAEWVVTNQSGCLYQGTSTVTVAAVPEPATWALMLISLPLLWAARGRGVAPHTNRPR